MTVPEGSTVTIEDGGKLVAPESSTLDNKGTIRGDGTLKNDGTINNEEGGTIGTNIENSGTIQGQGTITGKILCPHSSLEGAAVAAISDAAAEDKEFWAKWIPVRYPITYNLDGVTAGGNPESYTVEDEITLTEPEREGYRFTGWTGSNGGAAQVHVTIALGSTGDKSYTANWTCAHSSATHTPAVEATCGTDGTREYWTCDNAACKKVFSDEACTTETTVEAQKTTLSHSYDYTRAPAWNWNGAGEATVNTAGAVTGVSAGTVTVTAVSAANGSIKAACTVTVQPRHVHSYTYAASGNVITETCSGPGDPCGHKATATITAENRVHTGSAIITGSVAYRGGWQGGTLAVTYENNINVGAAAAKITKGIATVRTTFQIASGAVAVTGVSLNKTALALKVVNGVGESETLGATVLPAIATNKAVISTCRWSRR